MGREDHPLCSALVRLYLEDCVQFCGHPIKKKRSINCCNFSQGPPRWSGAGEPALWGDAEDAGLVQPGEEMASGILTAACLYLQEGYQESRARLFVAFHDGIKWDSRLVLGQRSSYWIQGKNSSCRTVRWWCRLPRQAVPSPSLGSLKTQLNKELCSLMWAHCWPWFAQEVGQRPSEVFQPKLLHECIFFYLCVFVCMWVCIYLYIYTYVFWVFSN